MISGPLNFVVIKDTSLIEVKTYFSTNLGSLNVFVSRTDTHPSQDSHDMSFDLSGNNVVQTFRVKPALGDRFLVIEKELFVGFYSTVDLPSFAFSFNFGQKRFEKL